MNTLIYYSLNLFILSLIVLIVGMIKPKWILLWMDKPGRMPIIIIASVIFMVSAVMFGEGNKQLKQAETIAQQPPASVSSSLPPIPGPSAPTPATTP